MNKTRYDPMEIIKVVLPGDLVCTINPSNTSDRVFLGPGLRYIENKVQATRAGLLKRDGKSLYYVDSHQKRYIPHKGEFVIGIVLKKKPDNYIIDIGGHEPATVSYLAFENASKKTQKEMKPGDLIYGQVVVANKDVEPELVCIDVNDRAVGMGVLPEGGLLFSVPLHVARNIISPDNTFLLTLSKRLSFSCIVGFNGRVWIRANKEAEKVAIMNAMSLLEHLSVEEALKRVNVIIDFFMSKEYSNKIS